jgi:hypothetical protein
VATIGAQENRYGDQHLATGRRRQPKKLTQSDGGSRNKLAVSRRQITRLAGTARRKGRGHKGPTVEKTRWKHPECNNGIRNRGATRQLRLRKERTMASVDSLAVKEKLEDWCEMAAS